MESSEKICCTTKDNRPQKGFMAGIIYGILPHSFCIAFLLFSIIGSVTATAYLKKFLMIPNLFPILVVLSLALATLSSLIYLKRAKCLCVSGIKARWKYISILYSSTVLVNLLIFLVLFPLVANLNQKPSMVLGNQSAKISLNVKIPCSGHAPLIIDELKKDSAVQSVNYSLPNDFQIQYDPEKTSPEKITSIEIFKTYPATILN